MTKPPIGTKEYSAMLKDGTITDSWVHIRYCRADDNKKSREARHWCFTNLQSRWQPYTWAPPTDYSARAPYVPAAFFLLFEDMKEAMLFKLTFGGDIVKRG